MFRGLLSTNWALSGLGWAPSLKFCYLFFLLVILARPKKWWAKSDEFSICGRGTLGPYGSSPPPWDNPGYAIVYCRESGPPLASQNSLEEPGGPVGGWLRSGGVGGGRCAGSLTALLTGPVTDGARRCWPRYRTSGRAVSWWRAPLCACCWCRRWCCAPPRGAGRCSAGRAGRCCSVCCWESATGWWAACP